MLVQVGSSGALVDKDTGATLRTAPGFVTVNYGLVNATLVSCKVALASIQNHLPYCDHVQFCDHVSSL
jgi:hypothetical protein